KWILIHSSFKSTIFSKSLKLIINYFPIPFNPSPMRYFLLSFLFLFGSVAYSQSFDKVYGGDEFDRGMHILSADDGGWIVCGYTRSFGNGYQIYLVKLDGLGNKQWEKNYGGAAFEMGWIV